MSEPTVPAADKAAMDETAGAALLAGELELAETLARSAIESGQAELKGTDLFDGRLL